MSETKIEKIEKEDIIAPRLGPGDSAIVFQRHEKYDRQSGSLVPEVIDDARLRDEDFFKEILAQDSEGTETLFLFVSSDTQAGEGGYRSLETGQIAEDAAISALNELGLDPKERIINLNPSFKTNSFEETGQSIRPDKRIREPQIFDTPEYTDYLKGKYGGGDILSTAAWIAHEMDAEKEKREELGVEGVYDILDRTKQSLTSLGRYASVFHINNPNKKLVIWVTSHHDTISPLVKDATDTDFSLGINVDYGAGVVIEIPHDGVVSLLAQGKKIPLDLSKNAEA